VPAGRGVFLRLLVLELGTPKLAQIFAYGKWLYPCRMLLRSASCLDQRCLKRAILRIDVLSRQISSPLPPKLPQNFIFGGPSNVKPIIHGALRKSHVNGATNVKFYSYIGIGKYLGEWGVSIFSARGRPGAQSPLMRIWALRYYLGNYCS